MPRLYVSHIYESGGALPKQYPILAPSCRKPHPRAVRHQAGEGSLPACSTTGARRGDGRSPNFANASTLQMWSMLQMRVRCKSEFADSGKRSAAVRQLRITWLARKENVPRGNAHSSDVMFVVTRFVLRLHSGDGGNMWHGHGDAPLVAGLDRSRDVTSET